jgi:hypothetical protein
MGQAALKTRDDRAKQLRSKAPRALDLCALYEIANGEQRAMLLGLPEARSAPPDAHFCGA